MRPAFGGSSGFQAAQFAQMTEAALAAAFATRAAPVNYSSAFHTYAPGCGNPMCASTRYANCRAISTESTGLL